MGGVTRRPKPGNLPARHPYGGFHEAPKTSVWRHAQFDTLRLTFVKVAAQVTERATRIKVALPSAYPHRPDLTRFVDRLVTLPP